MFGRTQARGPRVDAFSGHPTSHPPPPACPRGARPHRSRWGSGGRARGAPAPAGGPSRPGTRPLATAPSGAARRCRLRPPCPGVDLWHPLDRRSEHLPRRLRVVPPAGVRGVVADQEVDGPVADALHRLAVDLDGNALEPVDVRRAEAVVRAPLPARGRLVDARPHLPCRLRCAPEVGAGDRDRWQAVGESREQLLIGLGARRDAGRPEPDLTRIAR